MTVYVDDMRAEYRGMKMCHLIADNVAELHAMAARLGLKRGWFQNTLSGPHYDLSQSKRTVAIALGAKAITLRECACMMARWRSTGSLGDPQTAIEWLKNRRVTTPLAQPVAAPPDLPLFAHGKTAREQGGSSI